MLRNDREQNLATVEQHKECVMSKASCTDVLDCP